ncbi:hypothetical protein GCM10017714_20430 [Curtobacterium pusillum]|uniref:Protein-S-isoprenylcysteine O-methyltransferase Ste14 n=1 Tax=Curtobacterium pusillum TaxID=69373 RepID=A0AAW3T5Z0_9MICO|nr:hypothetical protein [Curtobacterium pusillum]MBA8989862.1 protein-S-isoprenylcysteine O-methyltransferase Ste14 [Curtobacterium pusillum]NUU14664.1 hypothetical protein [Curtobacterium pusillum]GLK31902.1 hypothetical protein GCM10017610_21870 [Curtobacterium pusillum]
MDIDFGAIGTVAGVGFVAAVGVVLLYTLGLRLLGTGQPVDAGGDHTQYAEETARSGKTPPAALVGAGVCFAVCIAAVLYGIWMTIPQFH